MKNLFDPAVAQELLDRIGNLTPQSKNQWGKMNIAQMLAHCSLTVETATSNEPRGRSFLGRILGPFVKPSYLGSKPLPKNSPTNKSFIVTDQRDFEKEKERLQQLIKKFLAGGETGCTTQPHFFFGKLTSAEWATSTYKHLDHHLQQFGV